MGNEVGEVGAGRYNEADVKVRRGQAKDQVGSRWCTLVVCDIEDDQRLRWVGTAILRL